LEYLKKVNKNRQICVVGWHFLQSFYDSIDGMQKDIFIVAHKYNKILSNFQHSIIPNVGLEFGAYDWFLKNMWDEKSDIIFMHDDIEIKNKDIFDDIFNKCENCDHAYIWTSLSQMEQNGYAHGRCFYLSKNCLDWIIKKYNGIWFDKENESNVSVANPLRGMHYNEGIRRFRKMIKRTSENGYIREHIIIPDIILYNRGKYDK